MLPNEQALHDFLLQLKQQSYRGVNVTHPYKVWAWNIIHQRVNTKLGLGALNTVILDGEELLGTNTDCTGFMRVSN